MQKGTEGVRGICSLYTYVWTAITWYKFLYAISSEIYCEVVIEIPVSEHTVNLVSGVQFSDSTLK